MKLEESYIVAVWILDDVFELNKEDDDDLAYISSSMDPFKWECDEEGFCSPMDPAKGEDWRDILQSLNISGDNISSKQAFETLIAYLEFYRDEFGFDLQKTIDLLKDMKNNPDKHKDLWEKWEFYITKAPEYKIKI